MIDKLLIDREASIYNLSDLGIEGQIIISPGLAEFWTETEQWTVGMLEEEERELLLYSLDPPESKRIRLSDDAYCALAPILNNLPISDKTNTENGNDGTETQEPIASYEV